MSEAAGDVVQRGDEPDVAAPVTFGGEGKKNLVQISVNGEQTASTWEASLRGDQGVLLLAADGKANTGGLVIATDEHPFWAGGDVNAWVKAKDLKPGMWLRTSAGTYIQVTATKSWTTPKQRVHNLTIADIHTYYVATGQTPVLVHNCETGGPAGLIDEAYDSIDRAYGPQVADGVDYQVQVMHGTDSARAASHTIPGIGHDPDALAEYFSGFSRANFTHVDTRIEQGSSQVSALYDADRGVAILRDARMIHGYVMSPQAFERRFTRR